MAAEVTEEVACEFAIILGADVKGYAALAPPCEHG